jgi:hypothetical protein
MGQKTEARHSDLAAKTKLAAAERRRNRGGSSEPEARASCARRKMKTVRGSTCGTGASRLSKETKTKHRKPIQEKTNPADAHEQQSSDLKN